MNIVNERPLVSGLVIGLIVGVLIGWFGIGWGVWPVEYQDAHPAYLRADYKADYVSMVAESYRQTGDQNAARERMQGWADAAQYACQLANDADDVGEKQKLQVLALVLSPQIDCGAVGTYQWSEYGFRLMRLRYWGKCDGTKMPEEWPVIYEFKPTEQ